MRASGRSVSQILTLKFVENISLRLEIYIMTEIQRVVNDVEKSRIGSLRFLKGIINPLLSSAVARE